MAKKNDIAQFEKSANVLADLEIGEAEQALANYLEVDLKVQAPELLRRCKEDQAAGIRLALRIGLRLLAVKAQCPHGEFEDQLTGVGIGRSDAASCMQLARAYASEGDVRRRDALLEMGKTKAIALLVQKPEVREQIMNSPELLGQALEGTTREFEAQLSKLKKQNDVLQLVVDNHASRKLIAASKNVVVPDIPHEVTDLRREVAALYQQASLAVQSIGDLPPLIEEAGAQPKADKWIEPTATQAYVALQSLHASIGIQMAVWRDRFGLDVLGLPPITNGAFYGPEEAALVASHFESLAIEHRAEGIKRANRRANEVVGKKGAKLKDV